MSLPVIFGDDFIGPAGAPPDPSRWELKHYKDGSGTQWDPSAAVLDGLGRLKITATNIGGVWHSGFPSGKVGYAGPRRIRARAKLAAGAGTWNAPAWEWGFPYGKAPCLEVDVCEQLGREGGHVMHTTVHNWITESNDKQIGQPNTVVPDLASGFYIYRADVHADRIIYYVGGVKVFTAYAADIGVTSFTAQMVCLNIYLNMGGWGHTPTIPGPASMLVDWVRVERLAA